MSDDSNGGSWVWLLIALGAVAAFLVVMPNYFMGRPRTSCLNACINNLRQIDGVKEQWALENKKPTNSVAITNEVGAFIKGGYPECPEGGFYMLGRVGENPRCSRPGHSL